MLCYICDEDKELLQTTVCCDNKHKICFDCVLGVIKTIGFYKCPLCRTTDKLLEIQLGNHRYSCNFCGGWADYSFRRCCTVDCQNHYSKMGAEIMKGRSNVHIEKILKNYKVNKSMITSNNEVCVDLKEKTCLSFGNGCSIQLSLYRLNNDGTISYYHDGKFNDWLFNKPTWQLNNSIRQD